MITVWYTVGWEYGAPRLDRDEAIRQASIRGQESEEMLWVFGNQEYSSDDPTPISARTYFWRECGFSCAKTSKDGR